MVILNYGADEQSVDGNPVKDNLPITLSSEDFTGMVHEELDGIRAQGRAFTAYFITEFLRAKYPSFNIDLARVHRAIADWLQVHTDYTIVIEHGEAGSGRYTYGPASLNDDINGAIRVIPDNTSG